MPGAYYLKRHVPGARRGWDYVLVDIGAHAPHGAGVDWSPGTAEVKPIPRNPAFQLKSWYDPALAAAALEYRVIGQIFFPQSGGTIDTMTDRIVLDYLASVLVSDLRHGRMVSIGFVGFASADGSDKFNLSLSRNRASSVARYVEQAMRKRVGAEFQVFRYRASTEGRGETQQIAEPGASAKFNAALNRRVDIVWKTTGMVVPEGDPITSDHTGPLPKPPENPIKWVRVKTTNPRDETMPSIPGVGRSDEHPKTAPEALAALIQMLAEFGATQSRKSNIDQRLERIADNLSYNHSLQPKGPNAGIVVAIERHVNKVDPKWPVGVGKTIVLGVAPTPAHADRMIEAYLKTPRLYDITKPYDTTHDFYFGTRMY